jgi:tRNA threonylcarbamoyl adenosine modification protein (Sua5/YciO/YrdC/YwlC family)
MSIEIQMVDLYTPHRKQILHAAKILENKGVVVYPTDTIYGLGADVLCREAVERILKIKKASRHKLLSFIFSDIKEISKWAYISNRVFRIIKKVLPGPYTFILPASKEIPKMILENRKTIGIRIPDSPIASGLVRELNRPILSSSVPEGMSNMFTDPQEIIDTFPNDIDLILHAGELPNFPSTVIDFTTDPPEIIRQGAGDISFL